MAMTASGLKEALKDALIAKIGEENIDFTEGTSDEAIEAIASAIVSYIKNNAVVVFTPGDVNGTCPVGGGPLVGGYGTNGRIN